MNIPLVDLRAQYDTISDELKASVLRILDSQIYVLGPEVEAFEAEFAEICGVPHVVAVSSGTAALHLALLSLGVGPGDEVITVSHTFIATAEAISMTGAAPVFVDIDPVTYLMDPTRIEAAITPRTRAIVPVHLYGQIADMDAILAVAERNDLPVIEDASQAHGSTYKGRPAGSFGMLGCFSFYPSKNLGTIGEGGAVVTASASLAAALRSLRDHGQSTRYHHDIVGHNYRMGALQGGALRVKLPHLAGWNARRREVARGYLRMLADLPVTLPVEHPSCRGVYHLFVVQVAGRNSVQAFLASQGIGTGVHYPVPIHRQRAYAGLGYDVGSLPVTEAAAEQILSLPMYAELTDPQIEAVAEALAGCLDSAREMEVARGLPLKTA